LGRQSVFESPNHSNLGNVHDGMQVIIGIVRFDFLLHLFRCDVFLQVICGMRCMLSSYGDVPLKNRLIAGGTPSRLSKLVPSSNFHQQSFRVVLETLHVSHEIDLFPVIIGHSAANGLPMRVFTKVVHLQKSRARILWRVQHNFHHTNSTSRANTINASLLCPTMPTRSASLVRGQRLLASSPVKSLFPTHACDCNRRDTRDRW